MQGYIAGCFMFKAPWGSLIIVGHVIPFVKAHIMF